MLIPSLFYIQNSKKKRKNIGTSHKVPPYRFLFHLQDFIDRKSWLWYMQKSTLSQEEYVIKRLHVVFVLGIFLMACTAMAQMTPWKIWTMLPENHMDEILSLIHISEPTRPY